MRQDPSQSVGIKDDLQRTGDAKFAKPRRTTGIQVSIQISDDPETLRTDLLPKRVQDRIETARQNGRQLVSIRWRSGKFALGLCEVGARWPGAKQIDIVYREPQRTSQLGKKGAKP